MELRISQGAGSNEKWWGVLTDGRRYSDHVLEADVPFGDVPLTAILKVPATSVLARGVKATGYDSPAGKLAWTLRRRFASLDSAISLLTAAYRDAGVELTVTDHRDQPQSWI